METTQGLPFVICHCGGLLSYVICHWSFGICNLFFALCHLTFPQATAFLLLGFVSCASGGRIFILDDGEDDGEGFALKLFLHLCYDKS